LTLVVHAVLVSAAMRGRLLVAFVLGTAAAVACGAPKLPAPAYTSQPTNALTEVPYPPPPARVEAIPPRPTDESAVWIDGEWTWQTRRWAWKPGRWVKPPSGARFAPWTTVRDRIGTLYFAGGTWRDSKGSELPEPEPIAVGGPAPAAVISPAGEEVHEGPTAPIDAGPETAADVDAGSKGAIEELDASRPSSRDGARMDAGNDQ
jgi:hypothetical protein